jgi:hypothetical protein
MGRLNPGVSLTLRQANFAVPIAGGEFVAVEIPGGPAFNTALAECANAPVAIGDTLLVDGTGSLSDVTSAASDRRTADVTANWDGVTHRMRNSCTATAPPCAAISPRLVVLPVFNVNLYEATRASGTPTIRIVNFVGFFINTVAPGVNVAGNLSVYPGTVDPARPQVGYVSAFLRAAVLYR